MADTAAIVPKILAKKPRNGGRKALKQKNAYSLTNEAAQKLLPEPSEAVPVVDDPIVEKENRGSRRKKGKSKCNSKAADKGTEKEGSIEELMELIERTEEMLTEKEEMLKEKMLKEKKKILRKMDEEKENLHVELRKLQNLKEFKPTLAFPIVQYDKDPKQNDTAEARPSSHFGIVYSRKRKE